MVDTSAEGLANYEPPPGVEFRGDPAGDARRVYNKETSTAQDSVLKSALGWSGRSIQPVLADAMRLQFPYHPRAHKRCDC